MDKIKLVISKYYHTTIGQLIRYGSIGVINTIIDICLYYTLTRHTDILYGHILSSKVISFLSASIFSFLANRWWTFHRRDKIKYLEIFKFYSTVGTGVFINVGVLYILNVRFHVFDLVAVLGSTILTFLWGFTFSKRWVFKFQDNLN